MFEVGILVTRVSLALRSSAKPFGQIYLQFLQDTLTVFLEDLPLVVGRDM